ncbi:MAG: hypothetical protein TREMPRED_000543 [Tremellales sp. Tagirdzhanova-0007]|nr:MAG: hypothetical protein TREMPRED_000543 [Tremellales sp. Tagirdzhanova-0007]
MLTTPYHFSIVACSLDIPPDNVPTNDVLYRGSLPAARNLPFIRRLRLRSIIYLSKKQLAADDGLIRWAENREVQVKWIRVESMGEEGLGMGRSEVGEVLKMILNPSMYPLYLADLDGVSHTTLVVACLRKLQGWHLDSIVNEICRFEPDHEDLPLVSFITSYLASTDSSLTLPPSPYPTWLWPNTFGQVISPPLTRTTTRERTVSSSVSSSSANTSLPFPHPLIARRHPTMRVIFPSVSTVPIQSPPLSSVMNANTLSRVSSSRGRAPGEENQRILAGNSGGGMVVDEILPAEKITRAKLINQSSASMSPGQDDDQPTQLSRVMSQEDATLVAVTGWTEEPTQMEPDVEMMDEYEDEEDEDEEEEEEDVQPTSQYISALDLAGFG